MINVPTGMNLKNILSKRSQTGKNTSVNLLIVLEQSKPTYCERNENDSGLCGWWLRCHMTGPNRKRRKET